MKEVGRALKKLLHPVSRNMLYSGQLKKMVGTMLSVGKEATTPTKIQKQ